MTNMEDYGLDMGDKQTTKTPWYKDKKWWRNLLENILGGIAILMIAFFILFCLDIVGEATIRNKYIKSVQPVVVTGIYDNSIPQFSDGKEIHSREYIYFLDYSDTTGVIHRHEINHWAPWLSGDSTYGICVGDTLNLYKFHSDGIIGLNGSRLVFEKGGNYYE